MKCTFASAYIEHDGSPHLEQVTFLKKMSLQRSLPDSWSKIQFQYQAHSLCQNVQQSAGSIISYPILQQAVHGDVMF